MKKTVIFLAMGLTLVGCTKSMTVDSTSSVEQAIGFSTFAHKATSKATIVNGGNLNNSGQYVMKAFRMSSVYAKTGATASEYFSETFGYSVNTSFPNSWNTEHTCYWPSETVTNSSKGVVATNSLSFFTYGPTTSSITFEDNGYSGAVDRTFPYLTVTVADENAQQKDILAAMREFKIYSGDGTDAAAAANQVNIDYNHILSAVTFAANTKDNNTEFKVKKIEVGVYRESDGTASPKLYPTGRYDFKADNEKGLWSAQTGDLKKYSVGLSSSPAVSVTKSNSESSNVQINANDQVLMLIPQAIEAENAYFSVTYDIYDNNGVLSEADITKYAPLFATRLSEWLAGKKYNYIFTLTKDIKVPIEYTVTVQNWDEQDVIEQFDGQYTTDQDLPVYENGGSEVDVNW